MIDNGIYWSKRKALSYSALYNFIQGGRGIGKTYSMKEWCISDFLKTGKEFVWVRRYKEELRQKYLLSFTDDIADKFPNHHITLKGKELFIDKEKAGTFIVLSTSAFQKSVPMPNVNKGVFDEFVLEKGVTKYLQNEVHTFLNLDSTIARMRDENLPITEDLRWFFLANRVSYINPYFDYFKIKAPVEPGFTHKNGCLIEICDSSKYKQRYDNTRRGKILKDTPFYSYAVGNDPYADESKFIENFYLGNCDFKFAIMLNDMTVGCWIDRSDYKLGFADSSPSTNRIYVIQQEDHSPNTLWLKTFKRNSDIQLMLTAYASGLIKYKNVRSMHIMNDIFSIIA